jgi:hypothetical protein
LIKPWSGRDLDGRTSSTSLSMRRSSPGRTGRGQRSSVEAGAHDAASGLQVALDQEPHGGGRGRFV